MGWSKRVTNFLGITTHKLDYTHLDEYAYLLVDTDTAGFDHRDFYTNDDVYASYRFKTKEEALDYLTNDVAPSERERFVLYIKESEKE